MIIMEKNIPFQSANKFSASQIEGDQNITLVKGAAEIVLAGCTHCLNQKGEKVKVKENIMFLIE